MKKTLLYTLILTLAIFIFANKKVLAAPSITHLTSFVDGAGDVLDGPRSVKIQGNYAYVLSQIDASITIFDISTPSSPSKIGQIQDLTHLLGKRFLEVSGNYVYAGGSGTNRLAIYDVSNPASPSLVTFINLTNIFWDLQIKGNYLYAFGDNGTTCFTVVDISTPSTPSEAAIASDPSHCDGNLGGDIEGNYLYTASSAGVTEYLTIFDISNPLSPVKKSFLNLASLGFSDANWQDMEVDGNVLYLLGWNIDVLLSINVTDSTNPILLDSITDSINLDGGLYIVKMGNAMIVDSVFARRLNIIDISDPSNISISTSLNDATNLNTPYDFDVTSTHIFVPATGGDQLSIFGTDVLPPTFANIANTTSNTSATLTWDTNEIASTYLDYGVSSNLGLSTSESDTAPRVINHDEVLSPLQECTTYFYQLKAKDVSGNLGTSSPISNFQTKACLSSSSISDFAVGLIPFATGGVLNYSSGATSAQVSAPAAYYNNDFTFQIENLVKSEVFDSILPPPGKTLLGQNIFYIQAFSTTFIRNLSTLLPVSIKMYYSAFDLANHDPSSMKIYRYDGSAWQELDNCNNDQILKVVTCETTTLGNLALFAKTNSSSTTQTSNNTNPQTLQGEYQQIRGFVYCDSNGDGQQLDPEKPLTNIAITITDQDGRNHYRETDNSGFWIFDTSEGHKYKVDVDENDPDNWCGTVPTTLFGGGYETQYLESIAKKIIYAKHLGFMPRKISRQ